MDLASKKWLLRFVEHFSKYSKEHKDVLSNLYARDNNHYDFLYKILHVTGLLFSHPTHPTFCEHPEYNEWTDNDKIKYLFTESLFHVYLFENRYLIKNDDAFEELMNNAVGHILTYYENFIIKQESSFFSFLDRGTKTDVSILEKIIDRRVSNTSILQKRFWAGTMFNTFIFLDLVYYSIWIEEPNREIHNKHERIQLQILKIISLGIQSQEKVQSKDRTILNYFISSALLSEGSEKKLEAFIEQKHTLDDIDFIPDLPLIVRYLYMDIGIVSILSDKEITESEERFLNDLSQRLNLDDHVVENSIYLVEYFIKEYAEKVIYLQNKHSFDLLGSSINKRLGSMVKKNKAKIIREISESRELLELLWKAQGKELSPEEKEKVKAQINDILRTLPSLAIFMIPGGSFILPILLKILPDELLKPSSFRN